MYMYFYMHRSKRTLGICLAGIINKATIVIDLLEIYYIHLITIHKRYPGIKTHYYIYI